MDFVLNHTSVEHPWFKEAELDKNSKYRSYYYWRPGTKNGPPTDWLSNYGCPVWQYEEHTGEYYLHMNAVKQADLNWENPEVHQAVYDMMKFWLDKGVDVCELISSISFLRKNIFLRMRTISISRQSRSPFSQMANESMTI